MLYENELKFLYDTLNKSRVSADIISLDLPVDSVFDKTPFSITDKSHLRDSTIGEYLGLIENNTIYTIRDSFQLRYTYLLLPDTKSQLLFILGPYVDSPFSEKQILEIEEKNGILPKHHNIVNDYLLSAPVISENSRLFTMLEVFGEHIWGKSNFTFVDVENEKASPVSLINDGSEGTDLDGILVKMKLMEKRYYYENELMQAVMLGQTQKADMLLSSFASISLEKRLTDSLRNFKNYCIIMNTLLRKAAENGGVHPMYLDRLSSSFAHKIEKLPSISDGESFVKDMFSSYCRLVRKHSIKKYTPIVQKTIVFIDADLSADLSLSSIAAVQNISPGYLSAVFKRETGKTLTNYVIEKRIKLASNLLNTTKLQIQTIALHCGIMDIQYFSKLFKKKTGKTPSEYRATAT